MSRISTIVFRRALLRLTDEDGERVPPDRVFAALEAAGSGLASSFRTWLPFAQVRTFREAGNTEPLSLNIRADDLGSAAARKTLDRGLTLAGAAGYGPLILEATEQARWDGEAVQFMAGLAARHHLKIAVDDYGAAKGYNDATTLGSGLIDYSQKITEAAMQMAEKKVCAQRS